jgi:hypothetical protein
MTNNKPIGKKEIEKGGEEIIWMYQKRIFSKKHIRNLPQK